MLKIGVLNSKGGVGKTLIATALCVRAARDFKRVALIDLDPQQGSARWRDLRKSVVKSDNPTLFSEKGLYASEVVDRLVRTGWDVAIFDGAPGLFEETEDAIRSVDLVVCPLRAADQDLVASKPVIKTCRDEERALLMVINQVNPRGDKRADEVRAILERTGLAVASGFVSLRVPFVDAMNAGYGVHELKKDADAATDEIEGLYLDVMKRVKAANRKREKVGG